MIYLKKLIFAPFFLFSFYFLLFYSTPILKSYDSIFSLSVDTFYQFIIICALTLICSFFFVLFSCSAQDWKFVLPVITISVALIFLNLGLDKSLIPGFFILATTLLIYKSLDSKLKSYLNFEPISLFSPSIRQFSSLLILMLSIIFFLNVNTKIQTKGFEIPDSLIDASIKLVPSSNLPSQAQDLTKQLSIPKEQIDMLKQNPTLLKQYGLDPSMLDSLSEPSKGVNNFSQNLIKKTLKDQFASLIKPFLAVIPAILAVVFFITLQSLMSFLGLLTFPLVWISFLVLEKTGFIKFTEEMRPVKKMVI